MKRREIIKQLSAIPLAGSFIAANSLYENIQPCTANEGKKDNKAKPVPADGSLIAGPSIYQSIGIEPVINCRGTLTAIGGSLELPDVKSAMEFASQNFVVIDELAMAVGRRLAAITGAEWGMVSAGCAAGMKHVTAACVTDGDPEKLIRIPDLTGFQKTEVIITGYSRNQYDHSVRNIGVRLITVNTPEELVNAISSRTAMVYLFAAPQAYSEGPLSIDNIAKICGPKNIPVLVDAAAEIFTIPNVHLNRGATIVAYSGGKAIRGPQCAGLLLGNKKILLAAWQASAPHHGPGRDNKLGKEEHIGMLAAVEAWTRRDHPNEEKTWIGWLTNISNQISKIESVKTEIREPKGLDNRSANMTISWDPDVLNITGEDVSDDFMKNSPRIALAGGRSGRNAGSTSISISAWQMRPGDDKIVSERIYEILTRKHQKKSSELQAPAASLSGHWNIEVEYFTGKSEHKLFIGNQDGNWMHGSYKSNFSLQDIYGTIDGNRIRLQSVYNAPGDTIPFTFDGTIADDVISGYIYMGEYSSAKFTGKRTQYQTRRVPIDMPSYDRKSPNFF